MLFFVCICDKSSRVYFFLVSTFTFFSIWAEINEKFLNAIGGRFTRSRPNKSAFKAHAST